MRSILCVSRMCFVLFLSALPALADMPSSKNSPAIVLEQIDESVLLGIRNTPDARFHIWTYDIASGQFRVITTGEHEDHYPTLLPGGGASRLAWNEAILTERDQITGFRSILTGGSVEAPVALDFIQHPADASPPPTFVTAMCLVNGGTHVLAREAYQRHSKIRSWKIADKSSLEPLETEKGYASIGAMPTAGMGEGHVVISEFAISRRKEDRFRLVLVDVLSSREIGLVTTEYDLIRVHDDPLKKRVSVILRKTDTEFGHVYLTAEDFTGKQSIRPEEITWLPPEGRNYLFVNDTRFWSVDNEQDGDSVIHVQPGDSSKPITTSVAITDPAEDGTKLDFIVSEDSTYLAATSGNEFFEVWRVALTEMTLLKRCRIQAEQDATGAYILSFADH